MARSLAQAARLLAAASSAVQARGFFVSTRAVGRLPQVHTGAFGGQIQGFS